MTKLVLLFVTLLLGMSFTILPDWDGVTIMTPDPFLFYNFPSGADGKQIGLCWQTYVYMIAEYLVTIILCLVIAKESTEYRAAIWVFFWLQVVDLCDYLLTYNSVWFYLNGFPVSMNILKGVIFGLTILYYGTKRD